MLCACEIVQLSSVVVLCVVRAVREFGFRLVINETLKRRPVDRRSCSDADS